MTQRSLAGLLAVLACLLVVVAVLLFGGVSVTTSATIGAGPSVAVGTAGASAGVAKKRPADAGRPAKWERVGPGTVVGVVREFGSDRLLEGVEVTLEAGLPGPNELLRATSRADGGFTFEKVTNFEAWTFKAKAPTPLADCELAGVAVVENRETDLGAVYLAPTFGVPGIVVDEKDTPVPGASVRAIRARPLGATIDLLRLIRELPSRPAAVDSATTADTGKFELKKVPPGNYDFTVEKEGYQIKVEFGVVINPDVKAHPLKFVVQAGFELAGTVTRESGEPVAGVNVVAFHEPDEPTQFNALDKSFAATDGKGAFRLTGLGTGRYVVAVTPEGEPAVAQRNISMPTRKAVDIVLKGECTLEGRITAEDGKAVEGALVYAIDIEGRNPTVGQAKSGADGHYEIHGLRSGPLQLFLVQAEGYGNFPDDPVSALFRGRNSDVKLVPGRNEKNVTLGKGGVVRGVVKEKGGDVPIAGVRVEVTTPLALLGGRRSATTGADGAFEITSVPKGSAILIATKDGWFQPGINPSSVMMILGARIQGGAGASRDSGRGATIVVSEAGETIERTLELARGSSLSGAVVAPDGTPVAGAQVSLVMEESGNDLARMFGGLFPMPDPRLTDAQGHYDMPGPPPGQKARVEARATGWLDGKSDAISCGVGEAKEHVDVKLRQGATLVGRVHDDQGRPVEGALVRWTSLAENAEEWSVHWRLRSATPAVADSKGEFRIANVETGKIAVEATEPRHLPWSDHGVNAEEGRPTQIDATLKLGAVIVGRVVTHDGRPKSGARVECTGTDEEFNFDGDSEAAITDGTGAFRIEGLGPYKYTLAASADGAAPSEPQAVDPGGAAVTLRLSEAFSITGAVRAKSGAGIADVNVSLVRRRPVPDEDGGPVVDQSQQVASTKTDAAGEFEFKDVAGGIYDVTTSVGWGPPPRPNAIPTSVRDVQAGKQGLVIEVEPGLTITGSVFGDDGESMPEGWVWARPMESVAGNVGSNAEIESGRFELPGLLPGKYRVNASGGGAQRSVVVEAGAKDVRIDFGGGVTIRVRVLKADRTPAAGAWVGASAEQGGGNSRTDDDGRCEIKGLPDGAYLVQSNFQQDDATFHAKQENVQVRAGSVADVELRLEKQE